MPVAGNLAIPYSGDRRSDVGCNSRTTARSILAVFIDGALADAIAIKKLGKISSPVRLSPWGAGQQAGLNKGRDTAMQIQRISVLTTIALGAMVLASPVMAQTIATATEPRSELLAESETKPDEHCHNWRSAQKRSCSSCRNARIAV